MKSNRKIRLLVTIPQFSPTTSPYREMIALARHIPKDEFALTICALRKHGKEEVAPELDDLGVNHMVAQYRPVGSYTRRVFSSFKDQSRMNQYGPYDIQHSLDFVSMPFEAFVARAQSRAYVFNQAMLGENLHWSLLRLKARLSKRVVAVSDFMAKSLEEHGIPAKKIRVVYLGIDLQEVDATDNSTSKREKGLILSVGRISPEKRHEDAIRALAEILKSNEDAHLKIVGGINDAAYHDRLKTLTGELGLNGKVEFTGLRKDVLQLLRMSECMIHCREDEPYGWVIAEALAVGCPVVACETGGPSDILENEKTGLLVQPGKIDGFAQAVSRILSSPNLAAQLKAGGRKAVEARFSSKGMVQGFRNIYQEVMQ